MIKTELLVKPITIRERQTSTRIVKYTNEIAELGRRKFKLKIAFGVSKKFVGGN